MNWRRGWDSRKGGSLAAAESLLSWTTVADSAVYDLAGVAPVRTGLRRFALNPSALALEMAHIETQAANHRRRFATFKPGHSPHPQRSVEPRARAQPLALEKEPPGEGLVGDQSAHARAVGLRDGSGFFGSTTAPVECRTGVTPNGRTHRVGAAEIARERSSPVRSGSRRYLSRSATVESILKTPSAATEAAETTSASAVTVPKRTAPKSGAGNQSN